MNASKKTFLIILAVVMGISFFIFQVNKMQKMINEEDFHLFPTEKIERIFKDGNKRREDIWKTHKEKEEEINENFIRETEEINNQANGTEEE